MKEGLLEEEFTYRIIGILFKVHNALGHLHQEKHYQRAIACELKSEGIRFEQEKQVEILFNGEKIGYYQLDFLLENKLVLETKTINVMMKKYHHQILSYMNQLQIKLGLLVNFRLPKLQVKRLYLPDRYEKSV